MTTAMRMTRSERTYFTGMTRGYHTHWAWWCRAIGKMVRGLDSQHLMPAACRARRMGRLVSRDNWTMR